jgi:hypothetical protein
LRARGFKGLHLIGGKDLGQFFLRFFFQGCDRGFLVVGELHFLLGKAGDQMKAGLGSNTSTPRTTTGTTTGATTGAALLSTAVLLTCRRPTTGPTIVLLGVNERNQKATGHQGGG